jgi:FecR protein
MRRLALLAVLTIAVAVPLRADRGQSYFTYDDGGTIVRQAEDNREVDVRVNLPVFPGDEVITSRRGRSEIRLSDGNVIALDRATDLRFRSILDSYDGNASQTVVELRYGHVIVQRTEYGHDYVRLDTDTASYVATNEAIYAIDTDRGHDRIIVFDGAVEVRTPQRTSSVRAGEEARVDPDGLYGQVSQSYSTGDEFERWYLRRAERYGRGSSRYLDRSLAYADYDLGNYGAWTYVSGFGTWAWRPRVAVGWRPFFYGEWVHGIGGSLIWVSAEPWGWVPYHYGRWAYDSLNGWVWLPGTGYSPAWVYWMYGPGYIGWAPAGWWDCYRPYYEWSYRPYTHHGWDSYWGVSGRVRAGDIDIRPWTFLNPTQIVGARADRAALSTDIVRERLRRTDAGGFATVSVSPARFTRGDLKDPVTAVNNIVNRGSISGGAPAGDITPFIRRDADLSKSVRDRIVRSAPPESTRTSSGGLAPIGGGNIAPIGGGNIAPIGGRNDGRISRGEPGQGRMDRGNATPSAPAARDRGGVIRRDETPSDSGTTNRRTVDRGGNTTPSWRDSGGREGGAVRRGDGSTPRDGSSKGSTTPATPAPSGPERVQRPDASPAPQPKQEPPAASRSDSNWRGRPVRGGETPGAAAPQGRGSDVPRRVIDRIGGARVYPSDGGRASAPPPRVERSSPPPSPSPQQHHDSGSSSKSSGSKDSGGRVHRDK